MIRLTRLNHQPLIVNCDLIEHMEMAPDTVISLTTGQKFMVRESSEEVVERVVEFRRRICWGSFSRPADSEDHRTRQCAFEAAAGMTSHGE